MFCRCAPGVAFCPGCPTGPGAGGSATAGSHSVRARSGRSDQDLVPGNGGHPGQAGKDRSEREHRSADNRPGPRRDAPRRDPGGVQTDELPGRTRVGVRPAGGEPVLGAGRRRGGALLRPATADIGAAGLVRRAPGAGHHVAECGRQLPGARGRRHARDALRDPGNDRRLRRRRRRALGRLPVPASRRRGHGVVRLRHRSSGPRGAPHGARLRRFDPGIVAARRRGVRVSGPPRDRGARRADSARRARAAAGAWLRRGPPRAGRAGIDVALERPGRGGGGQRDRRGHGAPGRHGDPARVRRRLAGGFGTAHRRAPRVLLPVERGLEEGAGGVGPLRRPAAGGRRGTRAPAGVLEQRRPDVLQRSLHPPWLPQSVGDRLRGAAVHSRARFPGPDHGGGAGAVDGFRFGREVGSSGIVADPGPQPLQHDVPADRWPGRHACRRVLGRRRRARD